MPVKKKKTRRCRCGIPLKPEEAYECQGCYMKKASNPPKHRIDWENPYGEDTKEDRG